MKKDEAIAKKLLKEKFDIDTDFFKISFEKEKDDYNKNVEIFKFLFNYKDYDLKRVVWNALSIMNYDKNDFSDKEIYFFDEHASAHIKAAFTFEANINKSYRTNRITLRPYNNNDFKTYRKHLKYDGDFKLYAGMKPTKDNLTYFLDYNIRSLSFVIEDNQTKKSVGHIDLYRDKTHEDVADIEYYIFKKYRNKGYAKEAIHKFVELAFTNKLLIKCETDWKFIKETKQLDIDIIRAEIRADNIPSQQTVKSCGFVHEGTIHKDYYMDFPPYIVDKEIYYIDKTFWNCKR